MQAREFRRWDLSYVPPSTRSSLLAVGLECEGIELLSVHRLTLHQILLMAPADAHWNSPVTLQMVADTCRQRKVKNYEPHVESMTKWLSSPSALWLFVYMKETVELGRYGPSMWHGDSGCMVYCPG